MQTLQDPANFVQHYQHGQEPTSASTAVDSMFDPHSRLPTAATEVDTFPISPTVFGDEVPHVIPVRTTDHRRTLVLCFDGTGNQFQNDNSNVVKFVSMLTKEEDKQLVYYQAGVGTYNTPQIANPWLAKIRLLIDVMFAWSLDVHIMGGYEFLMQNYRHGDKISILGFSRGAYTARSLAGVLDIVGLLPPGNQQQVPFLYRIYKDTFKKVTRSAKPALSRATVALTQAAEFKKAFSIPDVTIDFLGVWDTVESVGILPARRPFAPSHGMIRVFRHALSLDEHRAKFRPEFWIRPTKSQLTEVGTNALQKSDVSPVEEVWFSGCHCDVGGGSVSDKIPNSLARIPLRWMVRECFKSNTGILFYADKFPEIGMDPVSVYRGDRPKPEPLMPTEQFRIESRDKDPLPIEHSKLLRDPRYDPLTKPKFLGEEKEELQDTMSAIFDELEIHPLWRIVEYLPLAYRYQAAHDWEIGRSQNKGDPRIIPQLPEKLKVHRSVRTRMMAEFKDEALRAQGVKYKPRPALFQSGDLATLDEQVQWVG